MDSAGKEQGKSSTPGSPEEGCECQDPAQPDPEQDCCPDDHPHQGEKADGVFHVLLAPLHPGHREQGVGGEGDHKCMEHGSSPFRTSGRPHTTSTVRSDRRASRSQITQQREEGFGARVIGYAVGADLIAHNDKMPAVLRQHTERERHSVPAQSAGGAGEKSRLAHRLERSSSSTVAPGGRESPSSPPEHSRV